MKLLKKHTLPGDRALKRSLHTLSPSEQVVFWILAAVLIASTLSMIINLSHSVSTQVPIKSGTHVEGIIGFPRLANPLLASSDPDRALSSLTYVGLLSRDDNGELVPALAESYNISDDRLTYTFTLKPGLTFHDDEPVTSADVVFTINRAQEQIFGSALASVFDGVAIAAVDEQTVSLTLPEPSASFASHLTLGILPQHVWKNVPAEEFAFSQFNLRPVGAGPYKVVQIERNEDGLPIEYRLGAFENFAGNEPYIQEIALRFYSESDRLISDYEDGRLDAIHSVSPLYLAQHNAIDDNTLSAPLPRVFAIFFNSNRDSLESLEVREALQLAVDKQRIVDEVLLGYGTAINGPVPPMYFSAIPEVDNYDPEEARALLSEASNVPNELTITTTDVPELRQAAQLVAQMWGEVGIETTVETLSAADLTQQVIRPRDYEALLFGQVIRKPEDLFAFWHSSEAQDPGLNITGYSDETTDELLTDLGAAYGAGDRQTTMGEINASISADVPAVFLYVPNFIYLVPNDLQGIELGFLEWSSDRFRNVSEWYTETDWVWDIFLETER